MLFKNGPDGLDLEHPQKLWAYGPHDFTRHSLFNTMDRSCSEFYESEKFRLTDTPERISWKADCPNDTGLYIRVRFAGSAGELDKAPWSLPVENGGTLSVPEDAAYMQYQAEFYAPCACGSPRLTLVEIS